MSMSASNDRLRLTTLGSLSLRDSDGALLAEESKPLLVLAFLAAQPDRRAARSYLAALLWSDADKKHRKRSLRQALHTLRKMGAEGAVTAEGTDLVLDPKRIHADLWRIEDLFHAGRYDEAIELFGGPFLDSVRSKTSPELEHWAEAEDARIEVLMDRIFELAVERHRRRGDSARAVATARRWVRSNPLAEPRICALVEALLDAGATLEALQEARRYRTLVGAELGESPSRYFVDLEREAEERLSGQGASTEAAARSPTTGPGEAGSPAEADAATTADTPATAEAPTPADVEAGPRVEAGPTAGPHPPPRRSPRGLPPRLAWTSLAVVAGAVVAVLIVVARPEPEPTISVAAGTFDVAGTLTITSSNVSFRARQDLPGPGALRSPVRRETARALTTPDGTDLEVVDSTGAPVFELRTPVDEVPLDWSPDGERLLYRRGWYDGAGDVYRVMVGTWHRGTGQRHEFEVAGFDGQIAADWSPDGTRIAIGGGPRLLLTTPDGTVLVETERHGHVGAPRWSTSGLRLAVDVWDGMPADLYLLDIGTSRLEPLVRTLGDERSLAWLNHRYLLTISMLDQRRHLVLVDALNRTATLIKEDVEASWLGRAGEPVAVDVTQRIYEGYARSSDLRFIDSLHVEGVDGRLGVGEYVVYEASPFGPDGATIVGVPVAPDWLPHDGRLMGLGGGLFRAVTEGRATVSVSYPGWRTASFSVEVAHAERRTLTPVWRETWSDGSWRERWLPFGSPEPRERPVADDPRVAFALEPRGDQNYASGAMSHGRFATDDGLTVELWSRAPFTRELFQHWGVGLLQRDPDPTLPPNWSHFDAESWIGISAEHSRVRMAGMDDRYRIPLPDSTGSWRRYALQVSGSGEQTLLVDGRVHVRAPRPPGWVPGDSARIILSGQAIQTEILHGPLSVFEGELYRWR